MEFKNTEAWGFEHAIRGMRNPMNSWDKSDSGFCCMLDFDCDECSARKKCPMNLTPYYSGYVIGKNDLNLMQRLISAGSEHRKFMRQIFVSVDITAPLYWWKEFDTYKVGTTTNSTSTMHKITSQPITLDCFEIDDYDDTLEWMSESIGDCCCVFGKNDIGGIIMMLEGLRLKYIETKDKRYWKELIRWLPESWLQTRTVIMNYENIYSIVRQRENHKLNEWSGKDNSKLQNFVSWSKLLPYAEELIFYKKLVDKQ